jgi:chorismate mutase
MPRERTLRALRGAITVPTDDPESIRDATQELLDELMHLNGFEPADVVSAVFTVTRDLVSEFPAHGARLLGWRDVPMLCAQEQHVDGALPRCVRVLLTVGTVRSRAELRHVYLRDAVMLRPDLEHD